MVQLRRLKRQVCGELAGLGRTRDEVAASLHAADVLGVPRSNNSCALALYVSALMGSDPAIHSVTVGHCSLQLHLVGPDLRPAGRLMVQLPKPVRHFVAGFDALEYPAVTRSPVGTPEKAVRVEAPDGSGRPPAPTALPIASMATVATTGDEVWTDRPEVAFAGLPAVPG